MVCIDWSLQATRACALKMINMVACLIARIIIFVLTDMVKETEVWKLQVYESATCTNLQPVTLHTLVNNQLSQ